MADGEAEPENDPCPDLAAEIPRLEEGLEELESNLRLAGADCGEEEAVQVASDYCQRFCQTLLEYAEKWKASEDSLPLLEVYIVAIQRYSKARPYLASQCENVSLVLERLALSCVELLLCLPQELPDDHWQRFQGSIKAAHKQQTENGSHELLLLYNMSQESGVWKDPVLEKLINDEAQDPLQVEGFLFMEGPLLLEMRIKRLLKLNKVSAATNLAKLCCDHPEMSKKGHFMQLYLKCLCAASPNIKLIEEIAKVDCKDALEMICNLESEGDEKTSLILCAAFLSRQLQFGEMYCAWYSGLGSTLALKDSLKERFEHYLTHCNVILATYFDPRYMLISYKMHLNSITKELARVANKDSRKWKLPYQQPLATALIGTMVAF